MQMGVPLQPVQQHQQMMVTVPAGVAPGMPFVVQTPTGMMQITCPPEAYAGGQLMINIPQTAPVAMPMQSACAVQQPPMAVPVQQPACAVPVQQPAAMAMAMPTQPVAAVAMQPMQTAVPVLAPQAMQMGRANPPGTEPGGTFKYVGYCGPATCLIAVCICPCVCLVPIDQKEVYVAPDGKGYWADTGSEAHYGCCHCYGGHGWGDGGRPHDPNYNA